MYTDSLFNFFQITEELGVDEGAEILSRMASQKPNFALDTGIKSGDIWARVDRFKECLDLVEDENEKRIIMNMIHFSAGIMPDFESVENRFEEVENLENTINDFRDSGDEFSSKLIAIGPSGIDHDWDSVEYQGRSHDYFDNSTIDDERNLFALQLTLAKKLDMPFILHSRKGFKDTIDVLKAIKWNRGLVHGFSYTQAELEIFLDMGWYISFNGTVTYSGKKNFSDMSDLVTYVPKDRLIIETDAPYYAPVPIKNSCNEPNNISYVYEYIAAKRGLSSHKLSDIVDTNCQKLFGL